MANTDIRIRDVQVTYSMENFRTPLKLSSGPITGCDYASVTIHVENRSGQTAVGHGGIFLSDLWCFPAAALTHEEKTECMRDVTQQLAALLKDADGFYDPFQLSHRIDGQLRSLLDRTGQKRTYELSIPLLLGVVCWSPFDAALHDAWGKAAGRSCFAMYNRDFMNEDLSAYLGEDWKGMYPNAFLDSVQTKKEAWVQHVVGVSDPLTTADVQDPGALNDGLPVALSDWILKERVQRFKVKLPAGDVEGSVRFIQDIYRVASEYLGNVGVSSEHIKLSLDPNEGFQSPDLVAEMMARLQKEHLASYDAIEYIEQPTPRDLTRYSFDMRSIGAYKPVIVDESLDSLEQLESLRELGWSGVALKSCKGQSHTIISYCWAKRNGLYVTVQDLTNPGLALLHSAYLWARLDTSNDSLEYNSRQYAPFSFPEVQREYPELFGVNDGRISLRDLKGIGLY